MNECRTQDDLRAQGQILEERLNHMTALAEWAVKQDNPVLAYLSDYGGSGTDSIPR